MSEKRTEIIVKEIHFWKENKLLPAHYCDFLLALYTRGESDDLKNEKTAEAVKFAGVLYFLSLSLILFIALITLYILPVNMTIKSMVLLGLLLITGGIYLYQTRRTDSLPQEVFILLLILSFLLSLFYIRYFIDNIWIVNGFILSVYSLWLYLGVRSKMRYLTILGIIGFITKIAQIILQMN